MTRLPHALASALVRHVQDDGVSPLVRLQRKIKDRFQERLHCKNLAERLIYEDSLRRGLFRFLNQGSIFVCLLIAQGLTGDPSARRGIFNNLSKSDYCPAPPRLALPLTERNVHMIRARVVSQKCLLHACDATDIEFGSRARI
jgi:hypothetical protein